ncbi:hypothetical protein JW824_05095, partial [bacterium]|nr:hypothetical protein [bacterium]
MVKTKVIFTFISILLFAFNLRAQESQPDIENLQDQAPKVFIDGQGMDMNYIRTEITFVNYVRDPK